MDIEDLRGKERSLLHELEIVRKKIREYHIREQKEYFSNLSKEHSVPLFDGKEFTVTQAIRDYAESRSWTAECIRYWQVGQIAHITGMSAPLGKIRCIIDTPPPGSANCPFPTELIIAAIKTGG